MSTTEQGSREPWVNAATAAAWRRRLRSYLAPSPPAETDWKHASQFWDGNGQTAMDPADASARAFAESQQAGLGAMISLAEADAPPSAAALDAYTPWSQHLPSMSGPDTESSTGTVNRPDTAFTTADLEHLVTLTNPVLDRPPSAPRLPVSPNGTRNVKATSGKERRTTGNSPRFFGLQWLCLTVILTVQALLSLPLVWSNTAFLDEAIYISAGHVEIAHWLHGTSAPAYATYFSGAPVIYPPLGAVADSLGGLAAARLLSLLFMLGATSALWSLTSRLFGRRAAMCAAALFAVLGPTLRLGAFATFDSMALFLLAVSAWCMVSSRDRADSAFSLLAGTVLLGLANATKYSTMLFDPSVVALAGLVVAGKHGAKAAIARSGYVAAGTIGLISALLALGGPWYLAGLLYTTVSRQPGVSSSWLVIADSWKWIGVVCAIAGAGMIVCIFRSHNRVQILIVAVLTTLAVLAPLNQARIHTTTSLSKHVDFGAWFAAAAAGYAVSQLTRVGRRKFTRLAVTAFAMIGISAPISLLGRSQASEIFHEWPNSARLVSDLRSLTRHYPGHYLAEDYDVPAYYMENAIPWQQWSGTWYFSYIPKGATHPLTGLAAYRAAVAHHYFSLIILNFNDTTQADAEIITYMQQAGNYQVIDVAPSSVGQYTIWAYEPPKPSTRDYGRN